MFVVKARQSDILTTVSPNNSCCFKMDRKMLYLLSKLSSVWCFKKRSLATFTNYFKSNPFFKKDIYLFLFLGKVFLGVVGSRSLVVKHSKTTHFKDFSVQFTLILDNTTCGLHQLSVCDMVFNDHFKMVIT